MGAGEHGVTPIRTYSEAEARALGLLEDETAETVEEAKPVTARGNLARRTLRRLTVIR